MSDQTRGERNRNLTNINEGAGFRGDLGLEIVPPGSHYAPRFARFDTVENGIRACAKLLQTYQRKHGLFTIRGMINRWAPPSDNNDTSAYVRNVSIACGVNPDDPYPLTDADADMDRMKLIVRAVIVQENGRCIVDAITFDAGCAAAFMP
jgi:hypothetical protein